MPKDTKLKTCPFCGSDAHPHHNGLDLWSINCDNCSVQIEQEGGGFFTEKEAVEAWNKRTRAK